MQRTIAIALSLAVGGVAFVRSAEAQGKTPVVQASGLQKAQATQRTEIDAFRKGVDSRRTWRTGQLDVNVSPCPSSATSPCGAGAQNWIKFKVRFPAKAGTLEQVDHPGKHYNMDLIANLSARPASGFPICSSGFYIDQPGADMVVLFFPTGKWASPPGAKREWHGDSI